MSPPIFFYMTNTVLTIHNNLTDFPNITIHLHQNLQAFLLRFHTFNLFFTATYLNQHINSVHHFICYHNINLPFQSALTKLISILHYHSNNILQYLFVLFPQHHLRIMTLHCNLLDDLY